MGDYGYPRIFDLEDERKPKLISEALLEVSLPENCQEVTGQGAINGLGYSVHHCSPDRLYDPTILACSWFAGGMRVLDIRDPYDPVEIGYFNPGVTAVIGTAPQPVVRAERGEIWFVHESGFYVVRFAGGIWPFEGSAPCPEYDDYFYAQYNPGSDCATANLDGIGKSPPGGTRCAGRAATIVGRPLRGARSADVIAGGPGADRIRGGAGDDVICGGGGNNRIRGGGGSDRCLGGAGNRDRVACERTRGAP